MKTATKNRAILYLRVSDPRQVENYSLETQEKACREHCERMGWEVVAVFREEGQSAKTTERTQLKELLRWCRRRRADVMLVYRFSRAARNAADYHTIKALLAARNVEMVSVTETRGDSPAEHLLENVIAAVNQFDNEVRAEQCRNGMIQAARQGRWVWCVPLGYKKDSNRQIILDPEVAPKLREAFEMAATGISFREVSRFLKRQGISTKRGKPFPLNYTQRILRSPFYKGRLVNEGWKIDVPGQWEPLVSEDLWNRVQKSREERARPEATVPRKKLNGDFPLKTSVSCPECSRQISGSWSRGRTQRYAYYHCTQCRGFRVRKEVMEEEFRHYLRRLTPEPAALDLWEGVVRHTWESRFREVEEAQVLTLQSVERLKKRRERLLDLALDDVISQAVFEEKMASLNRQLVDAEIRAADHQASPPDLDSTLSDARRFLENTERIWVSARLAEKVRFQNLVFPRGLQYSRLGGFGTAVTLSVFNDLRGNRVEEGNLVEAVGVEPTSGKLRSEASTCVAYLLKSRREVWAKGDPLHDQSL